MGSVKSKMKKDERWGIRGYPLYGRSHRKGLSLTSVVIGTAPITTGWSARLGVKVFLDDEIESLKIIKRKTGGKK